MIINNIIKDSKNGLKQYPFPSLKLMKNKNIKCNVKHAIQIINTSFKDKVLTNINIRKRIISIVKNAKNNFR